MILGIYISIFVLDILVIYYVFLKEDNLVKQPKVQAVNYQKKLEDVKTSKSINYCPKCGTTQKGNNYCTNCGIKLD
jgi:hypothetical protein